MKTWFLKTTTALALAVSMAPPVPAQELKDLRGMEPEAALELLAEERAIAEAEGKTKRVKRIDKLIERIEAERDGRPVEDETESAEDTGEEESEVEAEAEAEVEAEPEVEAEAEAEPEAETQADAESEPEAEPEAETQAEAEPEAEPAPEAEAAETEAEDSDELKRALEAEAAGEAEAEAEAETEAEAEAETEAEAEVETETETADEPELVVPDAQDQADAVAEDDAAASAAAAAAATGDAGETAEAEVVEEVVTEETARSSDEEFETSIQAGSTAAQQGKKAKKKKDDDDEDERDDEVLRGAGAALLGLGALALGDMLRPDENVVSNTGDRVVVERDGQYRVLRNDDALLRQPGSNVTTYRFDDGSTRTVVVRENGTEIETIRARDGRVLRRTRTLPSGERVVLFDDTQAAQEVVISDLPRQGERRVLNFRDVEQDDLAAALARIEAEGIDRRFSLNQIRNIDRVRKLMPEINVDTVNFTTGSAVIRPEEAEELAALGRAIRKLIEKNPGEVFLIEGHTDAVGSASYNLALSDRRAESVALALTEYFDVPPENMVIQGYGEADLLIDTQEGERANRRAAVRRITPLLTASR